MSFNCLTPWRSSSQPGATDSWRPGNYVRPFVCFRGTRSICVAIDLDANAMELHRVISCLFDNRKLRGVRSAWSWLNTRYARGVVTFPACRTERMRMTIVPEAWAAMSSPIRERSQQYLDRWANNVDLSVAAINVITVVRVPGYSVYSVA